MKLDTVGGRRFIIMLLVILVMSILVFNKSITSETYGDVIKYITIAFILGNSFVEWAKNKP